MGTVRRGLVKKFGGEKTWWTRPFDVAIDEFHERDMFDDSPNAKKELAKAAKYFLEHHKNNLSCEDSYLMQCLTGEIDPVEEAKRKSQEARYILHIGCGKMLNGPIPPPDDPWRAKIDRFLAIRALLGELFDLTKTPPDFPRELSDRIHAIFDDLTVDMPVCSGELRERFPNLVEFCGRMQGHVGCWCADVTSAGEL